jgi:Tfp pilus assembly protein PilF
VIDSIRILRWEHVMNRTGHSRLPFFPPYFLQITSAIPICFLTLLTILASGGTAAAQFDPMGAGLTDLQSATRITRDWTVFGRVVTLVGDPIRAAKVKVDTGAARPEFVETNTKGEFSTQVSGTVTQYDAMHVRITASRDGYFTAHESVDYSAKDNVTREIVVVLREDSENSELLTPAAVVANLADRLRSPAAMAQVPGPALKDYQKGADKLFVANSPQDAASSLAKSVGKAPNCVNCRLLLCLAYLAGNGIASANSQEKEIDKLTESGRMPQERAMLLYIAGVVETWRNQNKNALGFFQKALEIEPSNRNVLLEMGRTLLLERNWEAADDYLERAIKAGSATEAHLLRARALMEEGDVSNAQGEMKTYIGDQPVRTLPTAVRLTYIDLQQRLEVQSLVKVNSVVNQPVPDLIKAMPELKGMEAAANQDALPTILQKVGQNVEAFFHGFSNTVSEEDIRVENLHSDGHFKGGHSEKDNYLLAAKPEKWGLGLTEYRAAPNGSVTQPVEATSSYMRTKGFASASVVFHPLCQNEARFRDLGRQQIDGRDTFVVGFAQQPEKAKMVGLIIANGVSEPALVQGVAWVDAQNYEIIRMRTDLLKPLSKVRLSRQTTVINYDEIHFKDNPAGLWLPKEVIVTVEFKGHTFRNSHTYTNFKHFNVGTEEKRKQS